jgi:hypothetical protein
VTDAVNAEAQGETPPEDEAFPPTVELDVYFLVGLERNGSPALYMAPAVIGFSRDRECDLAEARRITSMVSEELLMRGIGEHVFSALTQFQQQQQRPQSPADLVQSAMQRRLDEIADEDSVEI